MKELPWDTWSLFTDAEFDALKSGQTIIKTYDQPLWDTNIRGEHPSCIQKGHVFLNERKPVQLNENLTSQPQCEHIRVTVIRIERTQRGKGTKRRRYNYTYTFRKAEKESTS